MSTARKFETHYTVADYQQWEGDWELWYGTAVSMSPSPFEAHERAVTRLASQCLASIDAQNCECQVYAGLDWIVADDTVVRPDVMVVCGDPFHRHLQRPPQLAVEVLSEATAQRDRTHKRDLYEAQGVEHYLIVDLAGLEIIWFKLDASGNFVEHTILATAKSAEFALRDGCILRLEPSRLFQSPAKTR
jgi:Uma2 family endonuclease